MKFEKMTPKQLKQIREALGMSQEALARYLEVSARTVYRWEKGEHAIHHGFARIIRELAEKGAA